MIYGYARSTDGQSVAAQGCRVEGRRSGEGVPGSGEPSGAKTDRAQLRRLLDTLAPGDVLTVMRLDRLARSTRDLLRTRGGTTARS
jgi:DNA invertase Pin-like site-specific DNA recombinase